MDERVVRRSSREVVRRVRRWERVSVWVARVWECVVWVRRAWARLMSC